MNRPQVEMVVELHCWVDVPDDAVEQKAAEYASNPGVTFLASELAAQIDVGNGQAALRVGSHRYVLDRPDGDLIRVWVPDRRRTEQPLRTDL